MNSHPITNITNTIDLNQLDWALLGRAASIKPMQLHHLREGIRGQIVEVARFYNLPRLMTWGQNLSPLALDWLAHLGFLESHFWEALTGHISVKGLVSFVGGVEDSIPKEVDRSGSVDEGWHRATKM